jgi:hypothetical protein
MLEGFVRNQPEHKPNLQDPYVLCQLFEKSNKHLGLYYTKQCLDAFFEIHEDVCEVLQDQGTPCQQGDWDTKVETLQSLIAQVQNKYTHQMVHDRFVKTLYSAKKTPNDRALSHKVMQDAIGRFVGEVVDHDAKHRTAMDLYQSDLWQAIPEDWAEE